MVFQIKLSTRLLNVQVHVDIRLMGLIRIENGICVMIVNGINLMVFISDVCATRGRHSIGACMDGIHYLSKVTTGSWNFLSIVSTFCLQIQSHDCYEIVTLFNIFFLSVKFFSYYVLSCRRKMHRKSLYG